MTDQYGQGTRRRSVAARVVHWFARFVGWMNAHPDHVGRTCMLILVAGGAAAIVIDGGRWAAYGLAFGALAALTMRHHWT